MNANIMLKMYNKYWREDKNETNEFIKYFFVKFKPPNLCKNGSFRYVKP